MSKADSTPSKTALPLNSIRVFVEAARQLSFSRAAMTLGMTQGGVSHHISSLESYLGHRLFVRSGSSVDLTDAGRLYFDTVQEAIATIELSTRQFLQPPASAGRLVVRTSLPTFAMTALIPLLSRFQPEPTVSVDIVTSLSPPVAGDVYDVLITRDLVINDDRHWLLATEELICVASPAVRHEFAGQSMSRWPFLVTRSRPDVLSCWINQQPGESPDIRVTATFEHYFLALPAAIGGMGFLVIPRILALEPLRIGHLIETNAPSVHGAESYKAYINPETRSPDAAKTFCRWLKQQLRNDEIGRDGPPDS